jgi:PPOX class probable F420-dependent enzyme
MNRRKQIELTPEERTAYLEKAHTIILTTIDNRGYPHSVAMWFEVDPDGSVVMTTFQKSQKVLNVRRNPKVALLVESGRSYENLKGLLIRGTATLEPDTEKVLDLLERVNVKYHGLKPDPALREGLRGQASKRCLLRIHPERVASWDHQKLGGAY